MRKAVRQGADFDQIRNKNEGRRVREEKNKTDWMKKWLKGKGRKNILRKKYSQEYEGKKVGKRSRWHHRMKKENLQRNESADDKKVIWRAKKDKFTKSKIL